MHSFDKSFETILIRARERSVLNCESAKTLACGRLE